MSEIEPVKSDAARAFEALRGEVALLRRGVEALAAERRDMPNYGPSIEALNVRQQQLVDAVRTLAARPALALTPQDVARQMGEGVHGVSAAQAEALRRALAELQGMTEQVGARSRVVRDANTQRIWVASGAIFGWVLGMLSTVLLLRY